MQSISQKRAPKIKAFQIISVSIQLSTAGRILVEDLHASG